MIHTGSRGLGHQICTDHVRQMGQAMGRYGIHVPDRQLACVPVRSPEGQAYLAAMAAAANYGRANRQLLTEATRRVFEQETATSLDLLYDVSHNLAKIEVHEVHGRERTLCASERRDPLIAAAPSRPTRRSRGGRSARADSGHDGHRVLRAGGRSR
jgi:tRNA-splicing ligase RtcB